MIDDNLILEDALDDIIKYVTEHQAKTEVIKMMQEENEELEALIKDLMERKGLKAVDILHVRCIIRGGKKLHIKERS